MTGRELFARLRHLPKFLFQVTDLVTQTSRKLELQLFCGGMHLLGQLSNEISQILRGQSGLENLLVPPAGFLLAGMWHAEMRIAGFVRVSVSGTEQCLGVDVLLGEHVVDIGDLLDERLRIDAMFLIVAAVWIVFYKTKFGLRYRAIGDQPYAVQTAGVQVNRYRYIAMIAAGSIAGLAGSYLSISQNNLFVADMTAGRGFMGLAANIFGGWQPLGSMGAGMIFAVAQAARFYLTDASVPSQFVQMLPYGVTLLVLLFVGKRVKGPEALGKLVD